MQEKTDGVGLATSVNAFGVELRTRTKQREQGEGEKEEVRCEVPGRQKKSRLSDKLHEGWCEEVAGDALGLCEGVGRSSR